MSESGWMKNETGLLWFRVVPDKHLKDGSVGECRLLIIDGNGSHDDDDSDVRQGYA